MGRIVVGVDGSTEAKAALRWAVEEARLRQATLEVVHTWVFPAIGELPGGVVHSLVQDLEQEAARLLDRVVDPVVEAAPDVVVERRVIESGAGPVLVEVAKGADLLVVGLPGNAFQRRSSAPSSSSST